MVLLLNVNRLTYRESNVGWDLVTSHLLFVQQYHLAPPAIRIQAAEVLDSLLLVSPKNLTTGDDESNRRIQTQVLVALAAQAETPVRIQTNVDIDLRRMALETLFKILETTGHSFLSGWESIFDILTSACPSPLSIQPLSPQLPELPLDSISEGTSTKTYFEKPARSPVLVRTAFPSLQLVCTDFLESLTIDELRVCISTLSEFSKQTDDVNVSLTVSTTIWSLDAWLTKSIGWRITVVRFGSFTSEKNRWR